MSAKNCLVVGYPKQGDPYIIMPTGKGETHFSKKDAQRTATAHISDGIIVRAEVVQSVQEVRPGD